MLVGAAVVVVVVVTAQLVPWVGHLDDTEEWDVGQPTPEQRRAKKGSACRAGCLLAAVAVVVAAAVVVVQ